MAVPAHPDGPLVFEEYGNLGVDAEDQVIGGQVLSIRMGVEGVEVLQVVAHIIQDGLGNGG